jgi:carbon monoxide dehydrogenase subunit G
LRWVWVGVGVHLHLRPHIYTNGNTHDTHLHAQVGSLRSTSSGCFCSHTHTKTHTAHLQAQVGSLKSTANGATSGEFQLDEVPQAARAAGWAVDVQKVGLGAGDKKPVTVR